MINLKKGAFIQNVNGTNQRILAHLVDDLYAVKNEISGDITIQQFSDMQKKGYQKIEDALESPLPAEVSLDTPPIETPPTVEEKPKEKDVIL